LPGCVVSTPSDTLIPADEQDFPQHDSCTLASQRSSRRLATNLVLDPLFHLHRIVPVADVKAHQVSHALKAGHVRSDMLVHVVKDQILDLP
jgi:hypothetical protein